MKLDVYADPGHAWVKVKRSVLVSLGIDQVITPYSYVRGDYAYLEEDCDAGVLIEAARTVGIEIAFRMHHTNRRSRIRNYNSYRG